MRFSTLLFTFICAGLLASAYSHADAPLHRKLDLTTEQARDVKAIEKQYRNEFRPKRQRLQKELRKLRRARSAHDDVTMAQQEKITAALRQELKQVWLVRNERIRGALDPAQRAQFEGILEQRRASVGSSRDVKLF